MFSRCCRTKLVNQTVNSNEAITIAQYQILIYIEASFDIVTVEFEMTFDFASLANYMYLALCLLVVVLLPIQCNPLIEYYRAIEACWM